MVTQNRETIRMKLAPILGIIALALVGVLGMTQIVTAQTTTTEPRAKIVVDDAEIPQGQEAIIKVTLTENPTGRGLVSFQGSINYDPTVIEVLEVLFPEQCPVWAVNILNGVIRFAGTKCSGEEGDAKTGELFRIRILAIGPPGSTTTLTPIFEIFHDFEFKLIPHEVDPGIIVITGGGAVPPIADFSYTPASPTTNDTINFTDLSRDPDGRIVSWAWTFGDSSTSDIQTPSHKYAAPGTYSVSLTVTDNSGATGSATKQLTVRTGELGFVCINYPNPAKVSTTILCGLPDGTTSATLRIFNLTGRLVKSHELDIAHGSYLWDLKDDQGNDLPNGPYFYLAQVVTPGGVRITRVEVLIIER